MLDTHMHPEEWGIKPVLFQVGQWDIPSYSVFVLLGLLVGIIVYRMEAKRDKALTENTFFIVIAALVFGTIGAKLPMLIANYKLILERWPDIRVVLSGRTIVGGLIGGTIGVVLTKRFLGIRDRRGNQIAPAAAIGIAIGRVGCFLRGCCYGKPADVPWGVDFGDGVLRHPTQLYEVIFHLSMFIVLMLVKKKVTKPGLLFRIYVTAYFLYRFMIEFIRVERVVFVGLTGFQMAALAGLLYMNKELLTNFLERRSRYEQ